MVDYTHPTGAAGTLIIRDDGSNISFLIRCDDGATNIGSPGATWSGNANGSRSGRFTWASGGGTRLIAGPFAVSTSQTVSFGIGATGTSGLGGPASFSRAISRALPAAPSGLTVSRVSDSQQVLNWSRNATYTSVVVQRTTSNGVTWSGWQQVGIAAGNAFTFTDGTTVANRRYIYRVAGRNAAGQSAWSGQTAINTTPAPPGGISATRSGDNITVSASSVPPFASSYDVRDAGVVVASGVSLPWTHVMPSPATPHTYTVRANDGALSSAYSSPSNTVQLLAPPNAPIGLTPNGPAAPSDVDVPLRWVHNPVDSSAQTEFEVQFRAAGGDWSTGAGLASSELLVPLSVGAYEWQVRTKGAHPDWSPWSSVAAFSVIDRPGVAISQPDENWASSALTAEWTWFQAQGRPQSAWQAQLLDSSLNVIESRSGSGATSSVTFAHRLTEGSWSVSVRAATGELWSEWAEEPFAVAFDPPVPPLLTGEWDESQGGVSLGIGAGIPASADVEDGAWFVDFER